MQPGDVISRIITYNVNVDDLNFVDDTAEIYECDFVVVGCVFSYVDRAQTPDPGSWSVVPEPTILALMGLGLAGIGYRRHRSKIAA